MSMISAQIDELRELADDGSMEWVAGPIRASVLRDAADTIWQLRDDLQRTNAENAKLRELCWELFEAERIGTTSDYWHELCGRARELGIEVDDGNH